jgi:hypothetical protein
MLVSKYPNWVATIVYKDGHAHHFDGAKDMFKFWHDPAKYASGPQARGHGGDLGHRFLQPASRWMRARRFM